MTEEVILRLLEEKETAGEVKLHSSLVKVAGEAKLHSSLVKVAGEAVKVILHLN